ncbi:alcohol oxidase-like protein [Multifurca ochricompacta]|uniref:Alcohol oxidase-like protein n=1 Tax=Multifurca ochricompacta TaxID=376703 RepID=A0AAD4M4H7_9AGAM|nr:alcohol oxidase-like protein [Multifurca ochricompacta]
MTTPTQINEEYDIVIAGGGTAGCVIASRLAVADPDLHILILEAGPTTYNDPAHTQPARYLSHLARGSRTARAHVSQPSSALGGRSMTVHCGQCLGGGGSINSMFYTRACASDYDDWENAYKNPGWGSKDLIPLLRKTETYQLDAGGPTHGTDGPLKVSEGSLFTDVGQQFLQVARELDPDRAQKPDDSDTNDLETINVYTVDTNVVNRWIDAKTGTRSDVAHHFIYPLKETRQNLHFLTGIHVRHLTFDHDNRVTGAAFTLNPLFHPEEPFETRTVRARKLVVVSAGAFGTPGILERSGIGSKSVLDHVGIQQRVDLPGVGENYQDHNGILPSYFAAEEAQTFDAIFRGDEGAIDAATAEFSKSKTGFIAHNSVDAGIKWRPNNSFELAELGPEFKPVWDSYFSNSLDKPVLYFCVVAAIAGDPSLAPLRKYFSVGYFTEYPVARGHVHITHAEDVSLPLDFVPGYLESKADVTPLIWGYKFSREIARRMPHFRGEPPAVHPQFEPGGPAEVVAHAEGPVAFDTPRIIYSEEDERALEAFIRATVNTTWHALGTCAMKPREQGGVVDFRLNVYGVQNLKVADMSICPGNVAANTYSTALVIGEKAAVMIAEELGIKGIA